MMKLPSDGSGWSYVMAVPRAGFTKATLRGMYSKLPFPDGSLSNLHCVDSMSSVLVSGNCPH